MGYLKDKKGFTLVELLAVIVILGIVTVIGATTVLPYIQNSQKKAFVDEANYVIDAATNAISLAQLGEITSTNYKAYDNGDYCFTLKNLVDLGLWTKDNKALKDVDSTNGKYEGTVYADKTNSGYSYHVSMTNGTFYVTTLGGAIIEDNVATSGPITSSCPANAKA